MAAQILGSLDAQSLGPLTDVQSDYYGTKTAAASSDHIVYICDITGGEHKIVAQLKGHEGPVWKLAWAHPKFGNVIASCGYDMKVIIWKETSPSQWSIAHMDTSHTASVNDVKFCPWQYGLHLACASSDGTVSILSHCLQSQQWQRNVIQAHAPGAQALSWAPSPDNVDTSCVVMRLATGGCDNDVKVWKFEGDTWTQEMPPLPQPHSDWVRDVAWRQDNAQVMASGSWDKSVIVWCQDVEGRPWRQVCKLAVPSKVEAISWSATGSILAISCEDGETRLFNEAPDGSYVQTGKVAESGYEFVPNSLIQQAVSPNVSGPQVTQNGVQVVTLQAGDGRSFPKKGDTLTMHYIGTIAADGRKFDSSYDRNAPFKFRVGLGEVIEGWDEGVIQMSLGQKAMLKVPYALGYGEEGAGNNGEIPPRADLNFEVTLLQIN